MLDKLAARRPRPARINLEEQWERDYWVGLLGTTERALRDAIREVGPDPEAVRRHIRERQSDR